MPNLPHIIEEEKRLFDQNYIGEWRWKNEAHEKPSISDAIHASHLRILEGVRKEERTMFAAILTSLLEHGSKSRGDLERAVKVITEAISHPDKSLSDLASSIQAIIDKEK